MPVVTTSCGRFSGLIGFFGNFNVILSNIIYNNIRKMENSANTGTFATKKTSMVKNMSY